MRVSELSQLGYLRLEIEGCDKRLKELERLKAEDGQLAAEAAALEAEIRARKIRCIREQRKLERYISDIPDSRTRMIFTHRFVDGLSWNAVADLMGGLNTAEGVRQACSRYIRRHGGET